MNRRVRWLGLAVLAIVWLLSGCAPIYLPSTPNTPMLESEGDLKLSGKVGINGGEIQAAYALRDNTHLFGSFISSMDNSDADEEVDSSQHTYFELGGGRSWRPENWLVLEASGGMGVGSGRGRSIFLLDTSFERHAEGNYIKPFVQTNLAIQTRVLDFGFVNRLSLINFDEITETGRDPELNTDPSGSLFYEPGIYTQLGWDRLKFNAHLGMSRPLGNTPEFDHNALILSFGVNYRFSVR